MKIFIHFSSELGKWFMSANLRLAVNPPLLRSRISQSRFGLHWGGRHSVWRNNIRGLASQSRRVSSPGNRWMTKGGHKPLNEFSKSLIKRVSSEIDELLDIYLVISSHRNTQIPRYPEISASMAVPESWITSPSPRRLSRSACCYWS